METPPADVKLQHEPGYCEPVTGVLLSNPISLILSFEGARIESAAHGSTGTRESSNRPFFRGIWYVKL